jgi:CheY-like chemotaxis protein/HPt (histidine-containing phosphotransfer) domain-containing protein
MFAIAPGHRLPTVLLVDDDMVSREVMATVLSLSGYTVHTAAEGSEAISLLDAKTCEPEVILMDTQMPGLSGCDLIRELRARTQAVIYAISGSHAPSNIVKDADGFLMKPIGPEALQKVLREHTVHEVEASIADVPIVKEETLQQLRAIMPDKAVREIFDAVISDIKHRELALSEAIARGNGAEVRRIGHALKGGCGMAGAMQAARLGELLETRGDDLEYSQSILPELRNAAATLKSMLDAKFSNNG